MMFADFKDQMFKRSTEGRKYSKEIILRTTFFLSKRQVDMLFYLNTRFSDNKSCFFVVVVVVVLFLSFTFQKLGRSGDGKETKYFIGMALPILMKKIICT